MAQTLPLSNAIHDADFQNGGDGIALNVRDRFLIHVSATDGGMALEVYDAQRVAEDGDFDAACLRSVSLSDPDRQTFGEPKSFANQPGRPEAVAAFYARDDRGDGLDAVRGIGLAVASGAMFWVAIILVLRPLLG